MLTIEGLAEKAPEAREGTGPSTSVAGNLHIQGSCSVRFLHPRADHDILWFIAREP